MGFVDDAFAWLERQGKIQAAVTKIPTFTTTQELDAYYRSLPADVTADPMIADIYKNTVSNVAVREKEDWNLLTPLMRKYQDAVRDAVERYDLTDPAKADDTSAKLAADILGIALSTSAAEFSLALLPNTEGTVATTKVHTILGWMGIGAVINAVAHDPIKMGVLRPWQDTLEAKFRNRRPDDVALFQAYRTRELSPAKVTDIDAITDEQMTAIEDENQKIYDREIAKWGYSVEFSNALARSATRTLTFGNMMALARQGLLTRGYAIYNLWGYGLDRIAMKGALDALMAQNEMASYEGFRSMIEPSFVSGDIEEKDLVEYYEKIHVPAEIQGWVLPRLRKSREASLAKQKGVTAQKEKDLTVSQITQAYTAGLIKRPEANTMITALGYSQAESDILLNLAETRKKAGGAAILKRLTLTDYEKAYKAKLISLDAVLARMQGEYTAADIALEKELLLAGKA